MLCKILVRFCSYHTYDDFSNLVSIHLYNVLVGLEKLPHGCGKQDHSPLNLPTHQTFINACFVPGVMLSSEDIKLIMHRPQGG